VGGVVFNGFLLMGSAFGLWLIDRIPRRQFLIGSFYLTAGLLLTLITLPSGAQKTVVILFGLFAFVLSAAANLEYAYLAELFPTRLRASGIGLSIALSRVGSALGTFLLPACIAMIGVRPTLALCVAVLTVGGVVCQLYAPETQGCPLE
jgi:putative MFS transporter